MVLVLLLSKLLHLTLLVSSSSSSSSSSSIQHSFTSEDLVSAPNLELGCAVILHNCASDYIQTCSLFSASVELYTCGDRLNVVNRSENSHWNKRLKGIDCGSFLYINRQ